MRNIYPILLVIGIIGITTLCLWIAYSKIKDNVEEVGFDRHMDDKVIISRLLKYALPYKKEFIFVALLLVASIAYEVLSPLIVGYIEELIVGEFELNQLNVAVIGYAIILVTSMGCTYIQAIVLQKVGQKIVSALREDVFVKIESLSHEQLYNIPVGTLVTRTVNDTNAISMMFTSLLPNLAKNCFVIVGVLCGMLYVNVPLTMMTLVFVPFVVYFTVVFRKFSRRAYRKVKNGTTDINTFLSENLSGIKITQIFNKEMDKMDEFEEKSLALGDAKHKELFVFGIFRPLIYMLYIASILSLLYLGGRGYLEGGKFLGITLTGSVIITFYMYISKFYQPIQNMAEMFNRLQSALASGEKVFSILDIEPGMKDAEDAIEMDIKGEIEFKDVWFSYIPGEWVLQGVSFHIDAKQTVAFVGSTGSGKTTILSLICRNYEFQKGEILIDGVDIRKIKISSLRSQFGQMLQDVFL
ncbi:MAG: ATP-binding cassette domain-containing protein, partial [Erysipelotrichaceae bacterium]|nr:ATP-binding cassette domain-containing protein [Erysipelotrichaceae bacterium]